MFLLFSATRYHRGLKKKFKKKKTKVGIRMEHYVSPKYSPFVEEEKFGAIRRTRTNYATKIHRMLL